MKQRLNILTGLLGVAHVLVAIVLLPVIMFLGFFTIPVIVPGLIWLAVLGFRLWRPDPTVRAALRVTHAVLGPLAILLVVYGWFCLQAAQRSAETGGGLLGAVGLIPIVMGTLAGSLSIVSLFTAQSDAFIHTTGAEQSLGGDSEKVADSFPGAPQG
ncbi:MAG: hypothetical protein PVF14_18190 [Desulfobacterales bacterium]